MTRFLNACLVTGISLALTVTPGCGGGGSGGGAAPVVASGSFTIGGTVSGLTGSGLVLQNGGADDLAVSASGTFAFATKVSANGGYSVTVRTQPAGPAQTCSVSNGSGTVANANVSNVTVNCVANRFAIGGTVSGLAGTGLVLQNNGGGDLAVAQSGAFTFSAPQSSGSVYGVSVRTQPTNPDQTCAVSLGTGTVGSADVGDVGVECAASSISAASLHGSYRVVGYEPVAAQAFVWAATFDGTGAFDGRATRIDSTGATTSATLGGTYSVAADGSATVTETGRSALTGRLGRDGGDRHRVVLAQLTPGASPSIAVGLRQGQTAFTNANLAGRYTLIFYNRTVQHGAVAAATFDGSGNFHYTETENDAGAITTASNSGTYSVTSDGTLTLSLPLESFTFVGGISADADAFAAARANSGSPSMVVGVRQTGSFTNADFAGSYADVSFHSEGDVGVLAMLTADGAGTFTASETRNQGGVISSATATGNYAVDASGALRLTLTNSTTREGGVGMRGSVSVLTETTSGIGPSLHFGAR